MGLIFAYSNASWKRDPKLLKGFYEISVRQHHPIRQISSWLHVLNTAMRHLFLLFQEEISLFIIDETVFGSKQAVTSLWGMRNL